MIDIHSNHITFLCWQCEHLNVLQVGLYHMLPEHTWQVCILWTPWVQLLQLSFTSQSSGKTTGTPTGDATAVHGSRTYPSLYPPPPPPTHTHTHTHTHMHTEQSSLNSAVPGWFSIPESTHCLTFSVTMKYIFSKTVQPEIVTSQVVPNPNTWKPPPSDIGQQWTKIVR